MSQTETIFLAGGCFWGMEELLRSFPGIIETRVGYTGGATDNPVYETVKTGKTGHAETVKVVYRSESLEDVLEFFFKIHDPTTLNRQGNDRGTQYRSAVFCCTEKQKDTAAKILKKVSQSGKWKNPIVTEILSAGSFYDAEEYHQKYLIKNPGGYTCHFIRE